MPMKPPTKPETPPADRYPMKEIATFPPATAEQRALDLGDRETADLNEPLEARPTKGATPTADAPNTPATTSPAASNRYSYKEAATFSPLTPEERAMDPGELEIHLLGKALDRLAAKRAAQAAAEKKAT